MTYSNLTDQLRDGCFEPVGTSGTVHVRACLQHRPFRGRGHMVQHHANKLDLTRRGPCPLILHDCYQLLPILIMYT